MKKLYLIVSLATTLIGCNRSNVTSDFTQQGMTTIENNTDESVVGEVSEEQIFEIIGTWKCSSYETETEYQKCTFNLDNTFSWERLEKTTGARVDYLQGKYERTQNLIILEPLRRIYNNEVFDKGSPLLPETYILTYEQTAIDTDDSFFVQWYDEPLPGLKGNPSEILGSTLSSIYGDLYFGEDYVLNKTKGEKHPITYGDGWYRIDKGTTIYENGTQITLTDGDKSVLTYYLFYQKRYFTSDNSGYSRRHLKRIIE